MIALFVLSAATFCGCAPEARHSNIGLQPQRRQIVTTMPRTCRQTPITIRRDPSRLTFDPQRQMRELSLQMHAERKEKAREFQPASKLIENYQPEITELDNQMLGEQ